MSDRDLSKQFHIKSPCTQDWESMTGTDVIRFCEHCQLSVRDISKLSHKQFRKLRAKSGDRLCVRYVTPTDEAQRSTPVLHRISKRASVLAAGAFTASISVPSLIGATLPINLQPATFSVQTDSSLSTTPNSFGTAAITGSVFDPAGAVIARATITLKKMDSDATQVTTSDSSGVYKFAALDPGTYSLKFQAPGFAASEVLNVTVRADDQNRIDQTLSVAEAIMGGAMVQAITQPLVKAADDDDLAGVNEALRNNPDANVRDDSDQSALERAVQTGNRDIIQALLWAKADVNSRNRSGETPLMMLGQKATTELVWDLLNAGAKIDLRDEDGDTALIAAASVNNPEVLKVLLDAGSKINETNNQGETALMMAAMEGLVNNIRILIVAGADINARNRRGKTALDYARVNEERAAMRLLKNHGAVTFDNPNRDQ